MGQSARDTGIFYRIFRDSPPTSEHDSEDSSDYSGRSPPTSDSSGQRDYRNSVHLRNEFTLILMSCKEVPGWLAKARGLQSYNALYRG